MIVTLALSYPHVTLAVESTVPSPVDFNTQIRPILVANCTSCHGGVKQAGDVSFIYPDQILPPDGWIIEPGDPDASILIERIVTDDPDIRMPPPDEHPEPLSDEKIALLRRWISEGAPWQSMWATAPLNTTIPSHANENTSRPTAGEVVSDEWALQPLDQLVARRLTDEGLVPSPIAPPEQWLRRASFDLIGLPPSREQLQRFLTSIDQATDSEQINAAHAAEVDTMLSSPHFGERWASVWMDLARYADSMGFEKDPHRDMWPYRDWLIHAFNGDMPYDEFTIKQLAGDLLPDPTADDLIATAFHRNTQTNTEGGTDDEEFRVAALIDRVNTTWTVWQATTFGCVQCHSHPYDPIEHDEYFASLAMFNDAMDADLPNDYPTLRIPEQADQIETAVAAQRNAEALRQERNAMGWEPASQANWVTLLPTWVETTDGKLKQIEEQVITDGGTFPPGTQYTVQFDVPTLAPQESLQALKLEIMPRGDDPAQWPEQGSVLSQLTAQWIDAEGVATDVSWADVFSDAITDNSQPADSLKRNAAGVGEYPKLTGPRSAAFVFQDAMTASELQSKSIVSLRLKMRQSNTTSGGVATPIRRFRWSATTDDAISRVLASDQWTDVNQELAEATKVAAAVKGPSLPVIQTRPNSAPRSTRVFIRGNWMDRGDEVASAIPVAYTDGRDVDPSGINDRLKMARWLVSDDNPLAARVWVNRIWAQLFELGLVETLEDFGSSGLQPTHPELLDHLASRMRDEHDWHLKPFLRELILSATYRQTNHMDAELRQRDPRNALLARGPRKRLSAEMVRDQALAVSGLMVDEIGGPSVMPPQPDGIWQAVYSGMSWKTADGPQRYRRALYTYWRRTSPYPSFLMFDSPTRDLCSARRIATNTPLQALVTLNDPVYNECGQNLVEKTIREHCETASCKPADVDSSQIETLITAMYVAVTQSPPTPSETDELVSLYQDICETSNSQIDRTAMSMVASTLLNLDKALTR